jgi:hypothetical protein
VTILLVCRAAIATVTPVELTPNLGSGLLQLGPYSPQNTWLSDNFPNASAAGDCLIFYGCPLPVTSAAVAIASTPTTGWTTTGGASFTLTISGSYAGTDYYGMHAYVQSRGPFLAFATDEDLLLSRDQLAITFDRQHSDLGTSAPTAIVVLCPGTNYDCGTGVLYTAQGPTPFSQGQSVALTPGTYSLWYILNDGAYGTNGASSTATFTDNLSVQFSPVPRPVIGQVTELVGQLQVQKPDGRWQDVAFGDSLRRNDVIRTLPGGNAMITFADNTMLDLRSDTQVKLDDYLYDPADNSGRNFFSLLHGLFVYTSGLIGKTEPDNIAVDTPVGSIGIRGTGFWLRHNPSTQADEIYLVHGQVALTPKNTGITSVYDAPVAIFSDGTTVTTGAIEDTDGDEIPDPVDNCTLASNTTQCDSDGDGYGNRCDGDLNNNGSTNAQDTTLFRQQLGQPSLSPSYNKADLNCSGAVNAQDTTLFRQRLGSPPGPSGLH